MLTRMTRMARMLTHMLTRMTRWLAGSHIIHTLFICSSYHYYCENPICMRCTVTQLAGENVVLCPLSWFGREGIRVITQ